MARTPLCPHLIAARRRWRSANEDAGHEVPPPAPHRRAPQTLLIAERDRRAPGNTQMPFASRRATRAMPDLAQREVRKAGWGMGR
jgi:hypothetical protein